MRSKTRLYNCINLFFGLAASQKAIAAELRSPQLLAKDYLVFELSRNEPALHSQDTLKGDSVTYALGFRHVLADSWLMGVGLNFKSLRERSSNKALSFFTLTHEAYYLQRLYFPTYLFYGPQMLYMVPTNGNGMPLQRQSDIEIETGFAATVGVLYKLGDGSLLHARIDRWRGTKTNRYHGFQFSYGLSYAF